MAGPQLAQRNEKVQAIFHYLRKYPDTLGAREGGGLDVLLDICSLFTWHPLLPCRLS